MSIKKKIGISCAVIVVMFGIYNLFWFITTESTFNKFLASTSYNGKTENFVCDMSKYYSMMSADGYTYAVKKPDYLSFTGNLSVQKKLPDDEALETDYSCSLIVWISPFSKEQFGVTIPVENEEIYEIYINENGEPQFENSDSEQYKKRCKELLKERKDEINTLLENKKRVWK